MNIVSVNDYLANVAQVCRKAPSTTLRHAYMRAYREFCQQSQWLRTNIPGATTPLVSQYAMGNDPQLDIMGIFAMQGTRTANTPPGPQTFTITVSDSANWDPNFPAQQPNCYQYIPEGQFALYPTPDIIYPLLITLIIAPKEGAVNVPESPLVKWSNDIEAGALEYLLALPGMPWTDKATALAKGKEFRSGISNAKTDAQRSYGVGSRRARPRQFIMGSLT
jgi:hypothetical protein